MVVTYYSLAIVIGLTLAILCDSIFGIMPGGLVVPAYLAITCCEDIRQICLVFGISFIVYIFVHFFLEKVMILFGSRIFVACLITAAVIKYLLDWILPGVYPLQAASFHIIGIVSPALLANRYMKQSFQYTIPSCLIVSYLTYFLTIGIGALSLALNATLAVLIGTALLLIVVGTALFVSKMTQKKKKA